MRLVLAIVIGIILLMQPSAPAVYYVAPYGTATASGSADSPKSMAWALSSAPAGATVWLIPGTYTGAWAAHAPGVTYRALPGTRARVDGDLKIYADDVTVQGLEIYSSAWTARQGDTLAPVLAQASVTTFGKRTHILDNYIHDLSGGIGAFNGAYGATADLDARHNLIYNIGWKSSGGTGNGMGFYGQNDDAGRKTLAENVFANPYGYNIQFYGSSNAAIRHFDLIHNTLLNGRILIGGGQAAADVHVRDNRVWGGRVEVGYSFSPNEDAEITGNWIGNGDMQIRGWKALTVTNNLVFNTAGLVNFQYPTVPYSYTFNLNTYHRPGSGALFQVLNDNPSFLNTFSAWQARTGFDGQSTYSALAPAEHVFVQPWGAHRGAVSVLNWTQQPTVTLDLSALSLTAGAAYRLVNVQNPAEALAFVAGSPVALPTGGWTVAIPYGASVPIKVWDTRFAVFLVEPV